MTESERQRRQLAFSAVGSVLVLLLIIVTCSVYMWKKASKQTIEDAIEEVTICQIAADPAKYNKKLVKVTAFFSLGFEDSAFFDPSCPSRFNIWHDFGGKRSTGTMYCCDVVPSRTRPEDVIIEDITIPLVVDQNFETLDRLLRRSGGGIARGTVIGRFFSGEKARAADGSDWWLGYGHLGASSLFMIQQVLHVDQHDRTDVDYDSSQTYPDFETGECFYQRLSDAESAIEVQKQAEVDGGSWMFEDPKRVAVEALAKQLKRNPASLANIRLKRQAQGRMFYEWRSNNENRPYVVAVTRPYLSVFYAKTSRVAWVPGGVYRLSCND